MLIINSNKEANNLIKDGKIHIDDDILINVSENITINADIDCQNIYTSCNAKSQFMFTAQNIDCAVVRAININAYNINALFIMAKDINADNINATAIYCEDIKAKEIKLTNDINANNIIADNLLCRSAYSEIMDVDYITYDRICAAKYDINCKEINRTCANSRHFSLNGKINVLGQSISDPSDAKTADSKNDINDAMIYVCQLKNAISLLSQIIADQKKGIESSDLPKMPDALRHIFNAFYLKLGDDK